MQKGLSNMYKCIKDLQGGSFAIGKVGDLRYWQETASDWARSDDWNDWQDVLNWSLEEIMDWWQIELVKE